ncbi:MAG: hotdog domain-containing protein [bacterium]
MKTLLKLRLSQADAHYGGNLVDGAKALALFGDAATELLIRTDGDEGLFRAYDAVDFLAPLYAGDFVEVTAELVASGNTSRKMRFECRKIIAARPDLAPSAADVLNESILCVSASGTCVVAKNRQRKVG